MGGGTLMGPAGPLMYLPLCASEINLKTREVTEGSSTYVGLPLLA